jgi:MYXO-CTERM domain-containing protein
MTLVSKLARTSLAALGVAAAFNAHAVTAAELQGTWTGTWDITEWYEGTTQIDGDPFSAAITLVVTGLVGGTYGTVTVDVPDSIGDDYAGVIRSIGPDAPGNAVTIDIGYPSLYDGPAARLTGTLSGLTLTGRYEELDIPVENYVHWAGNVTLTTPVPEPGSVALAVAGLGAVCWRQRRRQAAA